MFLFTDALGRIYTVHPKNADCFYLRLLLINVRGPTSFESLRTTCFPSNAVELWNKYKDDMADDILHRVRTATSNYELDMTDEMRNEVLILIEDMCVLICGSLLCKLGMPTPNRAMPFNRELERERDYDRDAFILMVGTNVPLLTPQQKDVYDTLMKAIDDQAGGIFFVDAPGGIGKTFFILLFLA